jgi:hypothetical protein
MAGKLAPKKYGDRILTEQQQLDAQGNPITPSFIVNVARILNLHLHPKQHLALKTRSANASIQNDSGLPQGPRGASGAS